VPSSRISWPCIVTEKLDGVRRVLVKDKGNITVYSRSGHIDEGLVEIVAEAQYLPDNFVYDGELLAKGTFKDSIALRQATNSIANSKGSKTGLTFNIFDMIPVDEFYNGKSNDTALVRKIRLGATLMDESIKHIDEDWWRRIQAFGVYRRFESIKSVPILGKVNNLFEAEPIVEEIWKRGGEGIMLNTASGKYEIKRSKELLKVKHTEEYVLPIVNVVEGTGKYEDSLGAIVVEYIDKNGVKSYVGVGSGFTDSQRERIWQHPDHYIGLKAEIECFGESINAQGYKSLNCPIFKRFVGEE
jgi:DNA ligase-1